MSKKQAKKRPATRKKEKPNVKLTLPMETKLTLPGNQRWHSDGSTYLPPVSELTPEEHEERLRWEREREGNLRKRKKWEKFLNEEWEQIEKEQAIAELDLVELSKGKYPVEAKVSAASSYMLTGSFKKASLQSGVPRTTIETWKQRASWWPDLLSQLRKEKNDELDGTLTGIIDSLVGELDDRITKGDQVIGRDGRLKRKKLNASTLNNLFNTAFDKRAFLRGDPTTKLSKSSIEDHMAKLAKSFTEMAKEMAKNRPNEKIIDGEYTTHDDKKTHDKPSPKIEDAVDSNHTTKHAAN